MPIQPPNAPHHHLRSTLSFSSSPSKPHVPARYLLTQANRCFPPPLLLFDMPRLLPFQPLHSMPLSSASPSVLHTPVCGLHTPIRLPSSITACLNHPSCLLVLGFYFVFLFYFLSSLLFLSYNPPRSSCFFFPVMETWGCLLYLEEVLVGLKDLLKIMPLLISPLLGDWVWLKGHVPILRWFDAYFLGFCPKCKGLRHFLPL